MSSPSNELLEAALSYARSGWYVFPIEPPIHGVDTSGKAPIGSLVPNGKDNASIDESTIRAWWDRVPNANIGIAVEMSGLTVLDVDIADGKKGRESLATIDSQLTPTLTQITGSGGIHAVYKRPSDVPAQQSIGFLDGLDLIGKGYIVAAPSRHYTGGTYHWTTEIQPTALPPVLHHVQRQARAPIASGAAGTAPIEQGGRNNALFKLGAALRSTGIGADAVRASLHLENARRFAPPLPDDEVELVARSVMTRVTPNRDVAMGTIIEDDMRSLFPSPIVGGDADVLSARELIPLILQDSTLPTIPVPFEKLNHKLGGLTIHSMTTIVAPPGKGKTSLAGQLAVYHASNHGPCIYYVGEMTRQLVAARIAAQRLGVSWLDVIRLRGVSIEQVTEAIAALPIYFIRRSADPVTKMIETCKRAQAEGHQGIPCVVVDYIQLLADIESDMRLSTMKQVRRFQEFVELADVVAIVLSQSSRGGASRIREGADNAEELQDTGAETAEIERATTNLLNLSFKSKDDVEEHDVTMMVSKSRFGGGTKLGFKFNGRTGLWTPTDKPPVDDKHEQLCKDILHQIEIHESRKCVDSSTSCGKDVTRDMFMGLRQKIHDVKVSGTSDKRGKSVDQALQSLIDLGEICNLGGVFLLNPDRKNKPAG